jgi:hypothetical protein
VIPRYNGKKVRKQTYRRYKGIYGVAEAREVLQGIDQLVLGVRRQQMERRLQGRVEAIPAWLLTQFVPVNGSAFRLAREARSVAGVTVVSEDRAAVPIEVRLRRRHKVDRVAWSLIHDDKAVRPGPGQAPRSTAVEI